MFNETQEEFEKMLKKEFTLISCGEKYIFTGSELMDIAIEYSNKAKTIKMATFLDFNVIDLDNQNLMVSLADAFDDFAKRSNLVQRMSLN